MNTLVKAIRILSQHHPMYLYHLTKIKNVNNIAAMGLLTGAQVSDSAHIQFYTRDQNYFTDQEGISNWYNYFNTNNTDTVAILRVNINNLDLDNIYIDEIGTEDVCKIGPSGYQQEYHALSELEQQELEEEYKDVFAYYIEQDIPPKYIEIYDEESRSWIPIQEFAIRDY